MAYHHPPHHPVDCSCSRCIRADSYLLLLSYEVDDDGEVQSGEYFWWQDDD